VLVGCGECDWQALGHGKAGATQVLREVVPLGNKRGMQNRQCLEPCSYLLISASRRSENILLVKSKESQKLGIDARRVTKAVCLLGRQPAAFD